MNPLLNVEQLTTIFNVSKFTIQREIKRGRLLGTKVGKKWMFTKDAVESYIKSRTIKKAA